MPLGYLAIWRWATERCSSRIFIFVNMGWAVIGTGPQASGNGGQGTVAQTEALYNTYRAQNVEDFWPKSSVWKTDASSRLRQISFFSEQGLIPARRMRVVGKKIETLKSTLQQYCLLVWRRLNSEFFTQFFHVVEHCF